jgi:hypothetical protein
MGIVAAHVCSWVFEATLTIVQESSRFFGVGSKCLSFLGVGRPPFSDLPFSDLPFSDLK